MPLGDEVTTTGSFTEPEYAQTGLSEAKARATHDIVTAVVPFDSTTRTIIDGRTFGFCKLIAHRKTAKILGCQFFWRAGGRHRGGARDGYRGRDASG
jgi:dihydrolipoamide dehydrogenase